MNLSLRQKNVSNEVLHSTPILKDLCAIVAQYVFQNAFQNKFKKNFEFNARSKDWYLIQRDQKEFLVLEKADIDLVTGEMTPRAFYPYFMNNGWMNGKRWSWSLNGIYCNGVFITHLPNSSKWLGCDEELQEVYFITDIGYIWTINKKGTPLPPIKVCLGHELLHSLYQNPSECVLKKRKLIMLSELRGVLILVAMKLEQKDTLFFHPPISLAESRYLRPHHAQHLHIYSGQSEDEIWSFHPDTGSAHIYSFETLKWLRGEPTIKHLSQKQIGQTLYLLVGKKGKTHQISVYE